ncbi:hypothetical protein TNIN_58141 [Trichonephila inaurata madagascariensis]|uniref:Uncharacterized protein n=1 Tax=Trichonephila inaurata madagascariensis TaxID=2747483 RepID=A0A8X6YPY5_9ARAC|nr:hypothetical protein TNIN_58141 [Trichonephila inaurata madagascariensis]
MKELNRKNVQSGLSNWFQTAIPSASVLSCTYEANTSIKLDLLTLQNGVYASSYSIGNKGYFSFGHFSRSGIILIPDATECNPIGSLESSSSDE